MLDQLRQKLRRALAKGFWFPAVQCSITFVHERFSLNVRFNRWLASNSKSPPGASELYQFLIVVFVVAWVSLLDNPLHPAFTTLIARLVGVVVALYFITELLIFALHWTFVATGELHAVRRSLAGFLVNLFEVALLFSVALSLAGCQSHRGWTGVYENVRSVFKLELSTTARGPSCQVLGHYEVVVAATLLVIVIASLVGAVARSEKNDQG